jgi:hypothetical protein
LRSVKPEDPTWNELTSQLHTVDADLVFEFGPADAQPRMFAVSGDGLTEEVPIVQQMVRLSPRLTGWNIVAFRPPLRDPSPAVEYQGASLNPRDVWFRATPSGDKFDLDLYVRGWPNSPSEAQTGCIFLLLDHVIGEYSTIVHLARIESHPLAAGPKKGLKTLLELPTVVTRDKAWN